MSKSFAVSIFGATGEVGREVLAQLIASPVVHTIHQFGRTPVAADNKKVQTTTIDFEQLLINQPGEVAKVKQAADVVIVTLGTTRAVSTNEAVYTKIDREFVVAAARASRVEGKKQTLLYCSSAGASPNSYMFYPRTKGLTEQELAAIGYDTTIVFRPAMLQVPGGRKERRSLEAFASKFTSLLARVTDSIQIPTPTLGRAFVAAALSDPADLRAFGKTEDLGGASAFVIANAQAMRLAEEKLNL